MNKEMIIASRSGLETQVAILEDDQVVEVFIEHAHQRGVVGNIYKGRVSKVLPGMQSAFVDIGLERDAFLYVSDVVGASEEELEDEEGVERAENGEAARGNRERGERREEGRGEPREAKIEELLREGQEILVQVVKEPLGTKGARITSHVTLPGRFLVFMPTVDHVGVSRKIESREERARLRAIVREFREQTGFAGGVIVRTAAAGRPKEDILADLTYFHQAWQDIRHRLETMRAPALLMEEQSLVIKLLRDVLTEEFTAIRTDNEAEYRRVVAFVERVMPSLVGRVKLYLKDYPIFEEYGVQQEIVSMVLVHGGRTLSTVLPPPPPAPSRMRLPSGCSPPRAQGGDSVPFPPICCLLTQHQAPAERGAWVEVTSLLQAGKNRPLRPPLPQVRVPHNPSYRGAAPRW